MANKRRRKKTKIRAVDRANCLKQWMKSLSINYIKNNEKVII